MNTANTSEVEAKAAALTEYNSKAPSYYQNSRPEMLKHIPLTAATVLEIGCGSGDFAALVRAQRRVRYTAIEPFSIAAERARHRVDCLLEDPIEVALGTLFGHHFDCIVMNDVLEHLIDPWKVLREIRALMTPGGVIVASIPNIRYFPIFYVLVVKADWQYQDDGVLDRTHLRFYTRASIHTLFAQSQYEVLIIEGINSIKLPWKFGMLNTVLRGKFEDTRHLQFACVARPKEVER